MADLAVLSEDYFSIPEERIKHLEAVLTIVGGRIVYGDGDFGRLAPPPLPVSPDWSPVTAYGGYYRARAHTHAEAACCAKSENEHNHRNVLTAAGDLWKMGCDCFVY